MLPFEPDFPLRSESLGKHQEWFFPASHSLSGAAASAFCPSTAQQLSHQLTACYLKTVWKGFEFLITKHTSLLPQEKKKTEEEHQEFLKSEILWITDLSSSEEGKQTCTSQKKLIENQTPSSSGPEEVFSSFYSSLRRLTWRAMDGATLPLSWVHSGCTPSV